MNGLSNTFPVMTERELDLLDWSKHIEWLVYSIDFHTEYGHAEAVEKFKEQLVNAKKKYEEIYANS
jgi:hypothetical protein